MAESRVGLCFLDRPGARDQVRYAQLAEQRGFHSIWLCETRLARDGISLLGAMAATTDRIKLGTGIVNTWTRPVSLMAMTFATLDELAGTPGRMICGLGAYWEPLASKQGIDRRKPLLQMREYVTALRRLLALERVDLDGELVKVHDLELDLGHGVARTPKQVPIYIGATGDKMLELSGEIADGVVLNCNTSAAYVRAAMGQIAAGAARAGRDLAAIDRPVLVTMALDRDRDRALDEARYLITMYLGQQPHVGKAAGYPQSFLESLNEAMGGWPPRPGGVEAAMKLVGDDIVNELTIAGNADDCRRRARDYLDAGASYVVPLVTSDNVPEIIAAFEGF